MESNDNTQNDNRPIGFWLRLVDRQLTEAFATEFAADGFDRREWMLLNMLAGDADDARLARIARFAAKRGGRVMARLIERGWVTETDGVFTLTDADRRGPRSTRHVQHTGRHDPRAGRRRRLARGLCDDRRIAREDRS
ncbi:hypothetical protein ACFM35_13040 [Microbacterium sp. P01]|uniref:hypothetical protein n=1 Tax=Microbacterium sp. P01 TaxID=3366261 RepID=UPI0036707052